MCPILKKKNGNRVRGSEKTCTPNNRPTLKQQYIGLSGQILLEEYEGFCQMPRNKNRVFQEGGAARSKLVRCSEGKWRTQ